MGRDPAALADRFGTTALRQANEDALDALVADWVREHDRDAALEALVAARIPAGPVNGVADVVDDRHIRERGSLVEVEDPLLGALTLVAPLRRLEGTPAEIRSTGPALGAHTEDVLVGELGMSAERIAELRRAGVIGAIDGEPG